MLKKMEQAKKKAEAVVDTVDISEREKMAALKKYGGALHLDNITYMHIMYILWTLLPKAPYMDYNDHVSHMVLSELVRALQSLSLMITCWIFRVSILYDGELQGALFPPIFFSL